MRKSSIFLIIFIAFYFFSCGDEIELAEINVIDFPFVGIKSAIIKGNISFPGTSRITSSGVCYNTTGNPTILDEKTENLQSLLGDFQDSISNLQASKKYFVKAYAITKDGVSYSDEYDFKTGGGQPNIFNFRVKSNQPPSVVVRIRVNPNGVNTKVTFIYGTTTDYELGEISAHTDLINSEEVIAKIDNLSVGQDYNVKVIAENEVGTVESENLVFNSSYIIGSELDGGIIAYIDDTGMHGFVRSRNPISNQVGFGYTQSWGPRVETGATGIEIGDGKENTLKIEPFIEWYSVIGNVLYYEIEGNSDWYMASLKELEVIDQNLGLSGDFWSSSEYSADSVYSYNADTKQGYIEAKLANGYYQTGIGVSYF